MPYNVPALRKLRDNIEREAGLGKHNQGSWGLYRGRVLQESLFPFDGTNYLPVSCPTTACAAGWTVTGAGARMLFDADSVKHGGATAEYCLTKDGDVEFIETHAAEILGLPRDDRLRLFAGDTTTEQVLGYIDEIIVAAMHNRTWNEQRCLA
jgi:hypothetical protein